MNVEILRRLFERHFGVPATHVEPVQGQLGGSGRTILRLSAENVSAIGILHGGREENEAFLAFSRHFHRHGLPVPISRRAMPPAARRCLSFFRARSCG